MVRLKDLVTCICSAILVSDCQGQVLSGAVYIGLMAGGDSDALHGII
jgi:hypothetical protein